MKIAEVDQVAALCMEVRSLCVTVRGDYAKTEKDQGAGSWGLYGDHRLTAALKRRSMDLTRALARLRGRAK